MPFGLFKRLTQPKKKEASKKVTAPEHHRQKKKQVSKPRPKPIKWNINEFQVEPEEGKTRFHDLNLDIRIMRGIHTLGFQYCSPIQAQSLPLTLAGNDLIGKAQTGTGKTAAFLVTVLQKLLTVQPQERFVSEPRALILAPTRELALQIGKDADELAKFTDLNIVTVLGGIDYEKQKNQLTMKLLILS